MVESSSPTHPSSGGPLNWQSRYQQYIKWPIYSLLFLNFLLYVLEDSRTLSRQGYESIWDITSAYANSLDVAAWFGLLLVFEIETYWQHIYAIRRVRWPLNLMRLACFGVLAHTLVVYTGEFLNVLEPTKLALAEAFCGQDNVTLYELHNQVYTTLAPQACTDRLATGELTFLLNATTVMSDQGWQIALNQALVSLIECASWLAAGAAFATSAFLKRRQTYTGRLAALVRHTPHVSYCLIVGCALSWGWYGKYLYTYDSLLWLGGFAMIEANLSTWRQRIQQLWGGHGFQPKS